MTNADLGLQVTGKSSGDLLYNNILTPWGFNKNNGYYYEK